MFIHQLGVLGLILTTINLLSEPNNAYTFKFKDKILLLAIPLLLCKFMTLKFWTWWSQVDHSVIESFAQGGRTVISSRVYPTKAIYEAARLFVFNNATDMNIKASLKIWQLNSAFIRPFPFDKKLWMWKLCFGVGYTIAPPWEK